MQLARLFYTNRSAFFLIVWMAVVPLLFSSYVMIFALNNEDVILNWPYTNWLLFFLATCFSMAFALTPTTFIALISGYFLGWKGLTFILAEYLVASWLGYMLANYLDQGRFLTTIKQIPKVNHFIKGLNANQFGIIVLSRISPVLPFAIMNVVLSMIGVRLKDFLWAGFLGMLPRTIIFLWIGSQAKALREILEGGADSNIVQLSFILLLIIFVAGFYRYVKKIIARKLG